MRRILTGALIASCALFVAGTALAQAKLTPSAKHTEVKGEEYHHLLMLDLREAVDHARVLNHYARTHSARLERDVVDKHVEELSRNLDGIKTGLVNVEEKMGAEKGAAEPQLTQISRQEELARQDLDALKLAMSTGDLDRTVIAQKSQSIYEALSAAHQHHRKLMSQRGVHEPTESVAKK